MWSEKYKPGNFKEFIGNQKLIQDIKNYNWKKPLLIHGPTGVGKTTFAEATAREFNLEILRVRNENLNSAITASQNFSISGRKKLVLVDHVDKIGDIKKVSLLLERTRNPTILITSDFSSRRLKTIKKSCEKLQLRKPMAATIKNILEGICRKEDIHADREILMRIAENSAGDIRSAINDLQTVGVGEQRIDEKDLELIGPRDRTTDIYEVLSKVLMKRDFKQAIESTWNLNEQPRDILLWIDENLPRIYKSRGEIAKAYHYLSRADIFLGRIIRRQYWGFLRYATPLMTGGVNISKYQNVNFTRYQFPLYFTKLGHTKKERAMKKSIAEKLSSELHVSGKIMAQQYIPLLQIMLRKNKLSDEELTQKYRLTSEEVEFIKG